MEGNPFASCVYLPCVKYTFSATDHDIALLERIISRNKAEGGFNTHNRKVNAGSVLKYKEDMLNGDWVSTANTIDFEEDGSLADGQGRGQAVLASLRTARKEGRELSIDVEFKLGVTALHKSVVDTGRKRSFDHINNLMGNCPNSTVNKLAENLAKIDKSRERNKMRAGKVSISWARPVSTSHSFRAYDKYKADLSYIVDRMPDRESHAKNYKCLSRAGTLCAFVELRFLYPEEAEEFFSETTSTDVISKFNSLAKALYRSPIQDGGSAQKRQDYELVRKHFFENYEKSELIKKYS